MFRKFLNLFTRRKFLNVVHLLSSYRSTVRTDNVAVGENAIIAACINWFSRHAGYTNLVGIGRDGEPVPARLPDFVNANHHLVGAALRDLALYGNAFLLPAGGNRVDYIAPWRVSLKSSGDATVYEVLRYDGSRTIFPVVVHIRFGVSPTDPRFGVSPLSGVMREIQADNEATTALMGAISNGGIGATLISPEGEGWVTEDQFELFRDKLRMYATGDMAGTPMPMPFPVAVERLSAPLKEFDFANIKPELAARICGALGLDPMVLGLPSPNKTYSNYQEAIDAAYEGALIPMLNLVAAGFTSAKSLFGDARVAKYAFDLSDVRALQDDEVKESERIALLWQAGLITIEEARTALGFEPLPDGALIDDSPEAEPEPARNGAAR